MSAAAGGVITFWLLPPEEEVGEDHSDRSQSWWPILFLMAYIKCESTYASISLTFAYSIFRALFVIVYSQPACHFKKIQFPCPEVVYKSLRHARSAIFPAPSFWRASRRLKGDTEALYELASNQAIEVGP